MQHVFTSKGGNRNHSGKNTKRQLNSAVRSCLEALEGRQLLSTVSFPAETIVHPGDSVQVPITIDDAAGLEAVDFQITYDTNQLDIASADVISGNVLPSSWPWGANAVDAEGKVYISGYTPMLPTTGGSGTLFLLTFHVPANAPSSQSTLQLSGGLNEGRTPATLINGTVTVVGDETILTTGDAYQTNEDTPLTIAAPGVLANDQALDGKDLTAIIGTNPTHGSLTLNADGSFTYTPVADFNGTDTFTYQAASESGTSTATTVTITVNAVNDAPVANDSSDSVSAGHSVDVNLKSLVSDKETSAANIVISDVVLTDPASGTLTQVSPGIYRFTAAAGFTGDATFTYKATDAGTLSDTGLVTIHITATNDAPVAVDDSYTTNEDTPVTGNVLTNDSDPEGDTLQVVNGPQFINADGSFTYTPPADYSGAKTWAYTVSDGQGHTSIANLTITIMPVADAPVAADDTYSTQEGTPLTIDLPGVLENDNDVDGQFLTAAVVDAPAHGQLALNADGSFTYTPAADFVGTDSFTYKASDGALESTPATVTITVTEAQSNLVEVALPTGLTAQRGQTITVPLTISNAAGLIGAKFIIDYDTQLLNLTDTNVLPGSLTATNWQIVALVDDAAGHAVITMYAAGDPIASGSGDLLQLVFSVPADAPLGTTALTLSGQLNEGDPQMTPVNGSLEVVSAPVDSIDVSLPTDVNALPGATIHVPITVDNAAGLMGGNLYIFYDTDLLDITSANVLKGSLLPEHWVVVPNAQDNLGKISVSLYAGAESLAEDSGMLLDLVFTVAANAPAGATTITLAGELNDGQLPMNITTGTLNILPAEGVLAQDDAYQTDEDTALTIVGPGVLANDIEASGKDLTAVVVTQPSHGTLTLNPDGSFTYTPQANFNGTDSFTYQAASDTNTSTAATVTVTVNAVNDAPAATNDSYSTAKETALTIAAPGVLANDSDVDGDTLSAVLATGPSHGTLTLNADGSFLYTPEAGFVGTDSFTYSANDLTSATPATVSITVSGEVGSVLTLNGTDLDDEFILSLSQTGSSTLNVTLNGITTSYSLAGIKYIVVNGLAGNDQVLINATNGMPSVLDGIQVNGGTGVDKLDITSENIANVIASDSRINFDSESVTFPDIEQPRWDIPNGSSLTLDGRVVVLMDTPIELASLTLYDTAKLMLLKGGHTNLVVGDLNVSPTATLDTTDNAIIVRNTLLSRQESYDSIVAAVKHARGTGKWLATGLTSSVAQADAAARKAITGLAIVVNDKGNGTPIFNTIAGVNVGVNDIVVKYALNGDTNLDGKINLADYFRIDCGFIGQLSFYAHGDLNFDGKVDLADYFLIDAAFITQAS
ncbi:MAG TPA: Ig-like domain-containing protein, partial [Tepidisphaeraceae bacterium]|nr:Ig-like domain-containing protein [Tepidisphaeraceae bacterium]